MTEESNIPKEEMEKLLDILKAKPIKANNPNHPFKMPRRNQLHVNFKPVNRKIDD